MLPMWGQQCVCVKMGHTQKISGNGEKLDFSNYWVPKRKSNMECKLLPLFPVTSDNVTTMFFYGQPVSQT